MTINGYKIKKPLNIKWLLILQLAAFLTAILILILYFQYNGQPKLRSDSPQNVLQQATAHTDFDQSKFNQVTQLIADQENLDDSKVQKITYHPKDQSLSAAIVNPDTYDDSEDVAIGSNTYDKMSKNATYYQVKGYDIQKDDNGNYQMELNDYGRQEVRILTAKKTAILHNIAIVISILTLLVVPYGMIYFLLFRELEGQTNTHFVSKYDHARYNELHAFDSWY